MLFIESESRLLRSRDQNLLILHEKLGHDLVILEYSRKGCLYSCNVQAVSK